MTTLESGIERATSEGRLVLQTDLLLKYSDATPYDFSSLHGLGAAMYNAAMLHGRVTLGGLKFDRDLLVTLDGSPLSYCLISRPVFDSVSEIAAVRSYLGGPCFYPDPQSYRTAMTQCYGGFLEWLSQVGARIAALDPLSMPSDNPENTFRAARVRFAREPAILQGLAAYGEYRGFD